MASNALSYPHYDHHVASKIVEDCRIPLALTLTVFEDLEGRSYPSNPCLVTTSDKDLLLEAQSCSSLFTNNLWKIIQVFWANLDFNRYKVADYDHVYILYDEICLVQRSLPAPCEHPKSLFFQLETSHETIPSGGLSVRSLLNFKDLSLVLYGAIFGIVLYRTVKSE